MFIPELNYPGTWLVMRDEDTTWGVQTLLSLLESQLTYASLALNRFLQAEGQLAESHHNALAEWEARSARRRELEEKCRAESGLGPYLGREEYEMMSYEVDVAMKREEWQSGQLPASYRQGLLSFYARGFVYALDGVSRILARLSEIEGVSDAVSSAKLELDLTFPALKGVRDTAHHVEDRGRGVDRRGKSLDLKPIDHPFIRSSGGALVLDCLYGNRFLMSMEDGSLGEVELSLEGLAAVRDCIQQTIDSFNWTGPRRHYPS